MYRRSLPQESIIFFSGTSFGGEFKVFHKGVSNIGELSRRGVESLPAKDS